VHGSLESPCSEDAVHIPLRVLITARECRVADQVKPIKSELDAGDEPEASGKSSESYRFEGSGGHLNRVGTAVQAPAWSNLNEGHFNIFHLLISLDISANHQSRRIASAASNAEPQKFHRMLVETRATNGFRKLASGF